MSGISDKKKTPSIKKDKLRYQNNTLKQPVMSVRLVMMAADFDHFFFSIFNYLWKMENFCFFL